MLDEFLTIMDKKDEKVILCTNDDGIDAEGLKQLATAMSTLARVIVVAPTIQRSGESKSLTLKSPLRVNKISRYDLDIPVYSIDGTPADAVIIGRYLSRKVFNKIPDLVVSGINSGDNTSVHALLTSGTVAASIESSLIGIPSIAFSFEVPTSELFLGENQNSNYIPCAKRAQEIAKLVLENPLPEGVRFLNVNFPANTNESTPIEIVELASEKYENDVIEAKDPRNSDIYWIWGGDILEIEEGTDAYAVYTNKNISVTPVSLGFGRWSIDVLRKWMQDLHQSNIKPKQIKAS